MNIPFRIVLVWNKTAVIPIMYVCEVCGILSLIPGPGTTTCIVCDGRCLTYERSNWPHMKVQVPYVHISLEHKCHPYMYSTNIVSDTQCMVCIYMYMYM